MTAAYRLTIRVDAIEAPEAVRAVLAGQPELELRDAATATTPPEPEPPSRLEGGARPADGQSRLE